MRCEDVEIGEEAGYFGTELLLQVKEDGLLFILGGNVGQLLLMAEGELGVGGSLGMRWETLLVTRATGLRRFGSMAGSRHRTNIVEVETNSLYKTNVFRKTLLQDEVDEDPPERDVRWTPSGCEKTSFWWTPGANRAIWRPPMDPIRTKEGSIQPKCVRGHRLTRFNLRRRRSKAGLVVRTSLHGRYRCHPNKKFLGNESEGRPMRMG